MFSKVLVTSALCAVAFASPFLPYSQQAAQRPAEMQVLSDYFSMLGQKVQAGRQMSEAPVCNLDNAVLPVDSAAPLPPVSEGLTLKHVAIGRGIQNYTCSQTNATAPPVSIGAVATLYNASCVASTYPDLLTLLPNVALQFNLTSDDQATLSPSYLAISGHHYFANTTTPTFNLDTASQDLGFAPCSKNNTSLAPTGSPAGQGGQGHGSVAWLKLVTREGATGNLEEVYRVNTAGGNPPATCAGMPATFEVQYAAEYWFFEKPS
ncbi:malate dehydrogenase [Hyaloscypha variabilis]|uniref:Malate dehydrogenase n=1 Tax=Hyaloscypha variabilis (strain UAMH 11265 / GT02V1 / F) TaxID=1149755 RepID=A0A2J6RDM2_HYAVF|nr:malate dehydrogenase [Hyaloscypha variabilis F]